MWEKREATVRHMGYRCGATRAATVRQVEYAREANVSQPVDDGEANVK